MHSFLTSSGSTKSTRYVSFFEMLDGRVKIRARGGVELVEMDSFVNGVDTVVDVEGEGLEKLDEKFDTTSDGLEGTNVCDNVRVSTR
jgi:hypothetical protein